MSFFSPFFFLLVDSLPPEFASFFVLSDESSVVAASLAGVVPSAAGAFATSAFPAAGVAPAAVRRQARSYYLPPQRLSLHRWSRSMLIPLLAPRLPLPALSRAQPCQDCSSPSRPGHSLRSPLPTPTPAPQ